MRLFVKWFLSIYFSVFTIFTENLEPIKYEFSLQIQYLDNMRNTNTVKKVLPLTSTFCK